MRKELRNSGWRYLLSGCIIAVGLYMAFLLPGATPLEQTLVPSEKTTYTADSFECQPFRIDATTVLTEAGSTPTPFFKTRLSQGSIHSQWALDLIESDDADYMERILLTLIQPQVFDILFPFHYYS